MICLANFSWLLGLSVSELGKHDVLLVLTGAARPGWVWYCASGSYYYRFRSIAPANYLHSDIELPFPRVQAPSVALLIL